MRRGYGWWFAIATFTAIAGALVGGIAAGVAYAIGAPPVWIGAAGVVAGLATEAYMLNRADEEGHFSR